MLLEILEFFFMNNDLGHYLCLMKFLWWDHNGLKRYNELCSGILESIIAVWKCTPPTTTHNKAMPSLSYRVKVSRYSATCISDHLY